MKGRVFLGSRSSTCCCAQEEKREKKKKKVSTVLLMNNVCVVNYTNYAHYNSKQV